MSILRFRITHWLAFTAGAALAFQASVAVGLIGQSDDPLKVGAFVFLNDAIMLWFGWQFHSLARALAPTFRRRLETPTQ